MSWNRCSGTFGGRPSFGGLVTTIKCFEANGIIRQLVKEWRGTMLLIDGGGSLRRALIDMISQLLPLITVGKALSVTVPCVKLMRWLISGSGRWRPFRWALMTMKLATVNYR